MTSDTATSTTTLAAHELAAWRGLLVVHARVTQQLDAQMHAQHGLSVSAYEVLMSLAGGPARGTGLSGLAGGVLLSRGGCPRLVDRLVEQGYVSRSAASTDGRGLYAELTEAGVAKVGAARITHHEGIRRF